MSTQPATQLPEDYLHVEAMRIPRKTLRNDIRNTCKRFYDQEFTAKDVFVFLSTQARYKHHTGLRAGVRADMVSLADAGELEIVRKGTPANKGPGIPSIYRNPR